MDLSEDWRKDGFHGKADLRTLPREFNRRRRNTESTMSRFLGHKERGHQRGARHRALSNFLSENCNRGLIVVGSPCAGSDGPRPLALSAKEVEPQGNEPKAIFFFFFFFFLISLTRQSRVNEIRIHWSELGGTGQHHQPTDDPNHDRCNGVVCCGSEWSAAGPRVARETFAIPVCGAARFGIWIPSSRARLSHCHETKSVWRIYLPQVPRTRPTSFPSSPYRRRAQR